MQQGHTYVTDEAPAIPQTGDDGLSGHAPVSAPAYYAPPASQQPASAAVAAAGGIVIGAPAPAPVQDGQRMSSDEALARQLAAQEGAQVYGQHGSAMGGYPQPPVYGAQQLAPPNPQQLQHQPAPYFAPPPHPGAFNAQYPGAPGGPMPQQQQLTPIHPTPHAQQGAVQIQYINGQPVVVAMGMPVPQHAGYYGQQPGAQGYSVQAVAMPQGGMMMPGGGFLRAQGGQQQLRPGTRGHLPPGFWSDGLCECGADCGSCCLSCIFPPYRWAKTVNMAGLQTFNSAFALYFIPWLIGLVFYIISDYVPWAFFIAILAHLALVFVGCATRGRLRQVFQISGDNCEDCCVHCCCTCCAVAQEARHVDRDYGLMPPVVVYR